MGNRIAAIHISRKRSPQCNFIEHEFALVHFSLTKSIVHDGDGREVGADFDEETAVYLCTVNSSK